MCRGGENEESRGSEDEESRDGENEDSRDGENKESRGNVREKADKKKDGQSKSVQQKEGRVVSGEGLSGGKMVEDNESRERVEDCGSEEERWQEAEYAIKER